MRFLLLCIALLLTSCDIYQTRSSYLDALKKKGHLDFYTRNSMTTYYYDRDGIWAGFEYDLAKAFAKSIGIKVKVHTISGAEEGFQKLEESKDGAILGAGLTKTHYRTLNFRYSDPYYKVVQKVVCHRFGKKADNRNELNDVDLLIAKDTSYEENLERLSSVIKKLNWRSDAISSEQALFMVHKKHIDCTIVDSSILSLQQRVYPELKDMFDMSPKQSLHWYVSKDDYHMQRIVNDWLDDNQKKVLEIQEKYFGYLEPEFDYYDKKVFKKRIKTRMPQWKALFKKASRITGYDWRLLAAISYQESHWRKNAVSPTGVRGLMMLTRATAKRMGVTNRVDPEQSIMAGAKYLLKIQKRLEKEVSGDDLIWLSLASYNVGPGHVWDLIRFSKKQGIEVTWRNVKELLPKLTEKSFFEKMKYGYANGNEPLVYVDHIRDFYRILKLEYKK